MELTIGKFINGQIQYRVLEDDIREFRQPNGTIIKMTISAEAQFEELKKSGWKIVELIDETQLDNEQEFYSTLVEPIDKGDTIGFNYHKRFDKRLVRNEIERLKNNLASTDYKVIKCYEASLLSQELPYDIENVHKERQDIRDRINDLEMMIL